MGENENVTYIVLELQTNAEGAVGTLVTSYTERPQAESKYHSVLAAAAVSALPCHACVLMTNQGAQLESKAYKRGEDEQ